MTQEATKQMSELGRRKFMAHAAKACLGVGMLPFVSPQGVVFGQGTAATGRAKNCIYLYMAGGQSHIDTWDPKPGSDTQGPFGVTKSNLDGVRFSEHMKQTAKVADKLAVINSMHTTTGAHEQGKYFMRTGYRQIGTISHPAMGSWLVYQDGKKNDTLPPNILVGGGSSDASSGWMETRFGPLPIDSPTGGLPNSKAYVSNKEFYERLSLADLYDRPFRGKYNDTNKDIRAYTNLYADAIKLMNSSDLEVFDIAKENDATKKMYGENRFGQGCLLARRLVEQNVRFVEVHMGGWDTHTNNFDALAGRVPQFDQGFAALISDLDKRGLLSSTLVVVATEFGRTPRINANTGRDHHPQAFSCVLAGAGIKSGQVYGTSDAKGHRVATDGVTIPELNATIGAALGLDTEKVAKSRSGRPFTIANKGVPVKALLA